MKFHSCVCLLFTLSFVVAEDGGTLDYETQGLTRNKIPSVDVVQENQVASHQLKSKKKKVSRLQRCCHLGRRMAKIGESCRYATTLASIRPDYQHYHRLKTKLWVAADRPVIKIRLLRKCKRYKAFYEKCCTYESKLIGQDLKRMIKRLKKYLRQMKKGWKKVSKDKTTASPVGKTGSV